MKPTAMARMTATGSAIESRVKVRVKPKRNTKKVRNEKQPKAHAASDPVAQTGEGACEGCERGA
jgi:hypothetical protein